ncbi:MAG: hypothetical protein WDZ85_00625 [Candidatus Paceibacterota bacterium]
MKCEECDRDISLSGAPVCRICDPDLDAIIERRATIRGPRLCGQCFAKHRARHEAEIKDNQEGSCPTCGRDLPVGGLFCPACGYEPPIAS